MMQSVSLASVAETRQNNWRIIRLAAAVFVIFGHSFIVNHGINGEAFGPLGWAGAEWYQVEPLRRLTGTTFAALGVDTFFVASGFLVTRSLLGNGNLVDFALARSLRIYPALIVVVLLMAFVLGPLVTSFATEDYLTRRPVYSFVAINALSLSPFHTRFGLPGVFEALPYPNVVNASLWTLPWEVLMYLSLAAFATVGLVSARACAIVVAVLTGLHTAAHFGVAEPGPILKSGIHLATHFYVGALCYLLKHRIVLSFGWLMGFIVLTFATHAATGIALTAPLLLAYAVITLAYLPALVVGRLSEGDDLSYGTYLYAYPVQQTLVWVLGPGNAYAHTVLALLVTLPLAYLSWRFVEKPALDLKGRVLRRRSPVPDRPSVGSRHGVF
ncbi:MAG: acyltransferase [Hyphomicrobium sp.]|nr:acyltransferase [Hyphomicrobium sp.]